MVFNLDKCIGCHTCSVTCKCGPTAGVNTRLFNNVEKGPASAIPKE